MKRFFSLLCALSIIVGINAKANCTQVAQKNTRYEFSAKAGQQKGRRVIAVCGSEGIRHASFSAAQDEINVVFTETQIVTEYIKDENTIGFYGKSDAYEFYYIISLHDGIVGQYTERDIPDINTNWSYFKDRLANKNVKIATCTLNIAEDPAGSYQLTGTLTSEAGVKYNITVKEIRFVPTGDTIRVPVAGCAPLEWNASTGDFFTYGKGQDYTIVARWYPETAGDPRGVYNKAEHFDLQNCGVIVRADNTTLPAHSVALRVTQAEDTTYMDFHITAEDGNVYHSLLKNYTITAKDTVMVGFEEMEVSTDYLETYDELGFFGIGEAYQMQFYINVKDGVVGKYTEEDVDNINSASDSYFAEIIDAEQAMLLPVVKCDLEITKDDQNYRLVGALLCENEILYKVEIRELPFVPTGDTIEVHTTGYSSLKWYEEFMDFQAVGSNDDYEIAVDWIPDMEADPLGVYTDDEDFDFDYSYVYDIAAQEDMAARSIRLEVTEANDTIYMEVYILAEDGNVYHGLLRNYTITPKNTVDLVFTDMGIDDMYWQGYNILGFVGQGSTHTVKLYIQTLASVLGHYTEKDVLALNDPDYSFLGDRSTKYIVPVVSCSLDITASGDSYKLTGSMVCEDEVQYNFVIDANPEMAVGNVNGQPIKPTKTLRNGQIVIGRNGAEYNVLGAQIK